MTDLPFIADLCYLSIPLQCLVSSLASFLTADHSGAPLGNPLISYIGREIPGVNFTRDIANRIMDSAALQSQPCSLVFSVQVLTKWRLNYLL
jgi:hypothetical protein